MVKPTPEQWQALRPIERFNFRVTHFLNSSPRIRRLMTVVGANVNTKVVELCTSNIVWHHGFENLRKVDPQKAVLLVANHRSFFDLFAVSARLFRLYGAHHNNYFPVRANFFYDNPLALLVNLPVAAGFMYPPIIRDKKRRLWNKYATDLMVDLLKDPANLVGFHPEGTRNRGPDPYALFPPKPGCGELIFRSNPNVIPVFLQGFRKSFLKMLKANLGRATSQTPIVHMVMGAPMDFSAELQLEPGKKTY
ncbi:MAG: lysophospholipid acyltransferase family protein, partial [bacterium]